MRIAFVTQWFPPEPGTVVAAALADGLAGRGHQVDVITGFPNYPTGILHEDYPMQLYRRDLRSAGVTVHRAPLFPSHDAHAAKRILNYSSFAASASLMTRSHLLKPDVWLTYSSPATAAVPSLLAPRRLRAPSYLLIQDLWPDSVTASSFLPPAIEQNVSTILNKFCSWSYRRAAGIGVISPGMRAILSNRGVSEDKIFDTPNWVGDSQSPIPSNQGRDVGSQLGITLRTGPVFMYAGNLGELQGLAPLIDAFAQCPEIDLVLIGDGVARPALQQQTERANAINIHFVGSRPSESMAELIAASAVQIVSLQDTPLLRATMPSKVQSSMAAGRAILAHAAGDVAEVVIAAKAGLATRPGDVAAAVASIRKLAQTGQPGLREMGQAARAHYDAHFSADAGLDRLEAMIMRREPQRSHQ